ncbi:MAG TPA: hypothetical protein VGJ90_08420 [Methylophilaceae bacterium]|jgi:hypothetical protein
MIFGFEHFHPKLGEAPKTLQRYGDDIVSRARRLLLDRSVEEIVDIAKIINWIEAQDTVKDGILSEMFLEAEYLESQPSYIDDDQMPIEVQRDMALSINALRLYEDKFILPDTDINDLQWFEIYATLALGLIDTASDDEQYYGSWNDKEEWVHDWRILDHVSTWIIEAMEAITYAEGLRSVDLTLIESKSKVSKRNAKAAIQRHSKTNEAIKKLADMYKCGNYKSYRNAAQIYCDKNPSMVEHLAHHNMIRTLSDGLSEYLKGRRRSIGPE